MNNPNIIYKYFHHKLSSNTAKWYPIIAVYYLTYKCDFRCPYCSDGNKTPYYNLPSPLIDKNEVLEILKNIRKYSDYLVLTGGEPLNYPECSNVLQELKSLKFKEVIFTTNGHKLETYLNEISNTVNKLIFSIDTLDSKKANQWFGNGEGTFEQIMANIEKAAKHKKKKYEIIISSVVTPDNIDDIYDVYDFAQQYNFTLAAAPQLVGVKAHNKLENNEKYKVLFDFLISEKLKGRKVYGTVPYLQYLKNLEKFKCYPFTMLVVSPEGKVFYPCLEIGHLLKKIQDTNNLHLLRQHGEEKYGPQPSCDIRCHSACALGFSMIFDNPLAILEEAKLNIKSFVNTNSSFRN